MKIARSAATPCCRVYFETADKPVSARSLGAAGCEPRTVGVHRELGRGQEREAGVERYDRFGPGGDGGCRVGRVVGRHAIVGHEGDGGGRYVAERYGEVIDGVRSAS
jgi:hypothetical protein